MKGSASILRALLVAALLTALTPGWAFAQSDDVPEEPPASPLELLLEQRGALQLTSGQVGDLERIQAQLTSTNDPLVQRMMSLRTQWQQSRRAARNGRAEAPERLERIRTQAERIRTRIQQNNRDAMQRVNRMLTPTQRKQLRIIVQDRRQQTPGRSGGGGRGGRGRANADAGD